MSLLFSARVIFKLLHFLQHCPPPRHTHEHAHTTCIEFAGNKLVIIFLEKTEGIRRELPQLLTTKLTNSPDLLHPKTDPVSQSDCERSLWQCLLKTNSAHLTERWTNQWEKLGEPGPLSTATNRTRLDPGCLAWDGLSDEVPICLLVRNCSQRLGILFSPCAFKVSPTFSCGSFSPSSVSRDVALSLPLRGFWLWPNLHPSELPEGGVECVFEQTLLWKVPCSLPFAMPWPHQNVMLGRLLLITHWPPRLGRGPLWREARLGGREEREQPGCLFAHGDEKVMPWPYSPREMMHCFTQVTWSLPTKVCLDAEV